MTHSTENSLVGKTVARVEVYWSSTEIYFTDGSHVTFHAASMSSHTDTSYLQMFLTNNPE